MPISPDNEYLTPRLTFVPDANSSTSAAFTNEAGRSDTPISGSSGSGFRSRSKLKKALVSTFAFTSIGLLSATFALPAFAPGSSDDESPASKSEQHLLSAQALDGAGSLDALGSVELGFDFSAVTQISTESGLVDPTTLDDTKLRFPFDADWLLTDGFAYRVAPVEQFHDAQDIAASDGTPVLAIGSGVVVAAGYATDGCGFSTKIQHRVGGDTVTSLYCHMQVGSHDLEVGDKVSIGDQVGRVGNTGLSFGPHLHLSLRKNGEPIDPLPYIATKQQRSAK